MSASFASPRRFLQTALLTAAFLAGAADSTLAEVPPGQPRHQAPAEVITVSVPPGTREAYFAVLRNFSDKYGFAIRIAQTTPSGEDFLVQLFREDIKVVSTNALARQTFTLYFFSSCAEEADEITRKDISASVADLKVMLSKEKRLAIEPPKVAR